MIFFDICYWSGPFGLSGVRPSRSKSSELRLTSGEGDVKRLHDIEPPEFRLRVGDYRVRFHDFGDSVEILSVKHNGSHEGAVREMLNFVEENRTPLQGISVKQPIREGHRP